MFVLMRELEYEDSRKAYRDLKNSLDTAIKDGIKKGREEGLQEGLKKGREEGRKEGREEGLYQTARQLKAMGMNHSDICRATGLSMEEIESL